MRTIACLATCFFLGFSALLAQEPAFKSIHREQLEYYDNLGISADEYYKINKPAVVTKPKSTKACDMNKVVFGWHPYWSNGLEVNYDFSLLTDLSYFSYEVNASTGEANTTHSWATASVVDDALAAGVRVNLCVTLFSNHSTFFGSSTAQQTLISNLISLVQSRGAHGVNIDFEGVSSSLKTQLTNFMIDLCTQMHSAIPGSKVSICTYAVDWSDLFDEVALDPYIDYYTIMGYAYYWSGSTTAGPTAPLYTFNSYNYNLSKTINYYLSEGAGKEKLVLGLPYYGHEWNTTGSTVPSSTTSSVSSRTYKYVKNNSTGNYSDRQWESASFTPYYVYNSGNWRQCFCDDEISLGRRYDLVNMQDIAGIAIWALGYDDGYTELWDLIRNKFTTCATVPCSDTVYDMGGPNRTYFNDDDYTFTIAPTGAGQVILDFVSFDIEAGSGAVCDYDYLEIFDGPSVSSTNLGKFCNTTGSPGTITSSGNALTLSFHSDGATVNNGYMAIWTCINDNIAPVTSVSANIWETDDFTANFTDTDNDSVDLRFYQVLDNDGSEWRANNDKGFLNDNFETSLNTEWTGISGNWTINSAHLNQTNEDSSNTNLYIPLTQVSGNTYMYHWKMNIGGSGANRRAGLHFYCDDPTLIQRGNSYMVYFRVDQDKCQIYKSVNNSITIYTDDVCSVDPDTWYDYKVIFNTATGEIKAYQDNAPVSSWTDTDPFPSGNSLSLRTGNCNVLYDDVKVYRHRDSSETVTIGSSADDVRYQNTDPSSPSCRIKSVVKDAAGNFSNLEGTDINIDWTFPADFAVYDGLAADIDTTGDSTQLSANWQQSLDSHSGIVGYYYCIGDSPGSSNIADWTSAGTNNFITHTGLSLSYGSTYYFSVKAENGAGLESSVFNSDGQTLTNAVIAPLAGFSWITDTVCENTPVTFINQSSDATSFEWTFSGGDPGSSTDVNPAITFTGGTYTVRLVAFGTGDPDTLMQTITVTTLLQPVAAFIALDTVVTLPSAIAYFFNNSTDADS
ncbi:MAG: hypothetical protein KJ607_01265, partial [Bacteroidetes bacterium]|nr:hypothetical protein [Bacteroidota bacterium]